MPRGYLVTKRLLAAVLLLGMVFTAIGPLTIAQTFASSRGAAAEAPAGFDVQAFLERYPGVLKDYKDGRHRAAQVVEGYATYYSLDPRIILTLLELVPHLLMTPNPAQDVLQKPFGAHGPAGFTAQIDWAAREIRAGFGPYTKAPEVRFKDGSSKTLDLAQDPSRSEEHTSELQSRQYLVCRLLLEKKKQHKS